MQIVLLYFILFGHMCQGFTFPVVEHFLEDVLEKTRYNIKSESDDIEGNSRRKKKQQDSKKDPLTEMFEVCILYISINQCIYNIRDLEDTLNSELFYLHRIFCFLGQVECCIP